MSLDFTRVMCEHNRARSHSLDHGNAEVLVPHRVDRNQRILKEMPHFFLIFEFLTENSASSSSYGTFSDHLTLSAMPSSFA